MEFTQDQLAQIIAGNLHVDQWFEALTDSLTGAQSVIEKYDLSTVNRLAGFLAQCAHESAKFTVIRENLNYRWESLRRVFPKYFPTDELAQQYAHNQERIANRVYANRMGNGPEESGDGWKFSGRGLIQLTGKQNYTLFASYIGMSIDDTITHLASFEGAADSAGWFWDSRNINATCDADDIVAMTKKVNGGIIGLDERTQIYQLAKQVLGA